MEVPDELSVQDMVSGDPRPILRTIALPFDKVLVPSTPVLGLSEAADSIGRPPINESRWRRRRCGRKQWAHPDRLHPGDLEGGVDTHGLWQLKTDC